MAPGPAVVNTTGMHCNMDAASSYSLEPAPLNGRPHYVNIVGWHMVS